MDSGLLMLSLCLVSISLCTCLLICIFASICVCVCIVNKTSTNTCILPQHCFMTEYPVASWMKQDHCRKVSCTPCPPAFPAVVGHRHSSTIFGMEFPPNAFLLHWQFFYWSLVELKPVVDHPCHPKDFRDMLKI